MKKTARGHITGLEISDVFNAHCLLSPMGVYRLCATVASEWLDCVPFRIA